MVRWSFVGVVACLAACKFHPPTSSGDDVVDPMVDALDAGPLPDGCFGTFVVACLAAPPAPLSPPLVFDTNASIDSDTSPLCQDARSTPGGAPVNGCVIAARSIAVNAGVTVTAHGARPLILVATDEAGMITLDGTIDVASRRGGTQAAGGGTPCAAGTEPDGTALSFGGGYGGSFGGRGGGGGVGNPVGLGGKPGPATPPLTTLRGGCAGGNGGGTSPAAGGVGGGAVDLIGHAIVIAGAIQASGAGGNGSALEGAGGGGGGSGGTIVLDASTTIMIVGTATLLAQGGGGGEGSGGNVSDPGDDPTMANKPAAGGAGLSDGGDGGNGATSDLGGAGLAPTNVNSGGGGGGGGAGVIKLLGSSTVASPNVSPLPT